MVGTVETQQCPGSQDELRLPGPGMHAGPADRRQCQGGYSTHLQPGGELYTGKSTLLFPMMPQDLPQSM